MHFKKNCAFEFAILLNDCKQSLVNENDILPKIKNINGQVKYKINDFISKFVTIDYLNEK